MEDNETRKNPGLSRSTYPRKDTRHLVVSQKGEYGGGREGRGRRQTEAGAVSPQSQPLILTPSFIHSFIHPLHTGRPCGLSSVLGAQDGLDPDKGLSPRLRNPPTRQKTNLQRPLPPWFFLLSFHGLPWVLLSFVAGPVPPSARLSSAASRRGLVQAEHAGFGEQSRVWFQHLIQFVLPRLKYEMVASQTFKGRRRESERLLKFKF